MAQTVASRSVGRGTAGQAHSPFAAALIMNMQKQGRGPELFGLVRDDVMAATAIGQEPFVHGSLGGSDYFIRKP